MKYLTNFLDHKLCLFNATLHTLFINISVCDSRFAFADALSPTPVRDDCQFETNFSSLDLIT